MGIKEAIQILDFLREGRRPGRPMNPDGTAKMSEDLWQMVNACWSDKPEDRPAAERIHTTLEHRGGA